jgi:hypothetical protein
MLFYRAALPLSHQTLTFVSGLVRTHRREIGTPWRALTPAQQALLVLVHLRKGEPFAQVGAGFGVSTSTCWRYVNETVELLAGRAPKLRAALRKAAREKMAYVIIDGTLIPIDRIAADRPFYSGKHTMHGMNLQVIASPDGTILWVSGQLPGNTHDTAAARIWNILAALRDAGLIALGDKGYHGYDEARQHVITPYKGKNKPEPQKDANRAHARLRGPGERANAQLKYWRILHKVRVSPRRVGRLAKAIHVLQNYEGVCPDFG